MPRARCVLRASGEQIIADGAWSSARFGCVLGLCRLPEDGGDAVYHSRSILIIQLQHKFFGRKPFQARRLGASALARRRQERGRGQGSRINESVAVRELHRRISSPHLRPAQLLINLFLKRGFARDKMAIAFWIDPSLHALGLCDLAFASLCCASQISGFSIPRK